MLADGCLLALCCAARGFQQRARALVESQEADETTKLRKTANFHLSPNALVFVKILCCAFADALLLIISSDELLTSLSCKCSIQLNLWPSEAFPRLAVANSLAALVIMKRCRDRSTAGLQDILRRSREALKERKHCFEDRGPVIALR